MSAIPKKKLCWQCEGGVSSAEDNCPYCGVYLHPDHEMEASSDSPFAIPLFQVNADQNDSLSHDNESFDEEHSLFHTAQALCLMVVGSTLLLFAAVLGLFSTDGVFTLQWNASYWYLYALCALPLLYWGWQALVERDSHLE
jgi:hypothetical protein